MSFNLDPKINVNIQGRCVNWLDLNKTYNIIRLQPHKVGTKNVLAQTMLLEPNTKYIVNYNFDLNGETIRVPEDCILEIDGGNISNGILIGNQTILLNPNGVDILQNVTLQGTWKNSVDPINNEDITYSADNKYVFADKYYNAEAFSGLGRIFIRKNIQESVTLEDKFYCVLGADGFRYIFCVYQNEFYYIFNNGAGLVLNRNVVYENLDYKPEYVPIFVNKSLSYQRTQGQLSYDVFMPDGNVKVLGNNDTVIDAYQDGMLDRYVVQKNILEQSVFAYSNTRYILQYDFDINSKTITLPENCYLDFQGGSINSTGQEGTLISPTGSVTTIISFQEKEEILKNVELVGEFVFTKFNQDWIAHKVNRVDVDLMMDDIEDTTEIKYIQKKKRVTLKYGPTHDDQVSFDTIVLIPEETTKFKVYWHWKNPTVDFQMDSYNLNENVVEGTSLDFPQQDPAPAYTHYNFIGWECEKNNKLYTNNYVVSSADANANNEIHLHQKWELDTPGTVIMYSFSETQDESNYKNGTQTTLVKDKELNVGKALKNFLYHYIESTTPISVKQVNFTGELEELGSYSSGWYIINNRRLLDSTIKYN